jgi:hypothetical protein
MYVKARFLIKFEQTKSYMVPIFYLIDILVQSMIDLIQLLNLKLHYITKMKMSCSLCKLPLTTSPNESEFDGFHSIHFSRCIHKIDHNSFKTSWTFWTWNKKRLDQQCVIYLPTSRNIWGYHYQVFKISALRPSFPPKMDPPKAKLFYPSINASKWLHMP